MVAEDQQSVIDLLAAPATHGGEPVRRIDTHSADLLLRGHLGGPTRRPVFGSVVSKLRGATTADGVPNYVALGGENGSDPADPSYTADFRELTGEIRAARRELDDVLRKAKALDCAL